MFQTEHIKLIEPKEVVGGCISIYRNIWENPEETIKQIEEYNNRKDISYGFKAALTIDGKPMNKRTNMDLQLMRSSEEDESMKALFKKVFEFTWATAIGYNQYFNMEEETHFNEDFNILKYQTGQEYKAHYDGGSRSGRSISPIFYLNNDYEGG